MNKQILFWVLQTLSWGFIAILNAWGKTFLKSDLNRTYIYLEAFLFFSAGIIASTIVRAYLKKHIKFDTFQTNEVKKIFLALLIGTIILFGILMFAIPIHSIYHPNNDPIKAVAFYSTAINSVLYIFFWMVLYISINMIIHFRKNKLERLELEASLKESQLNTLKGQINPHFMFNSLNNIRGLMLEDVDKSREMITRLSEMLRYSLTKNNLDKIALSEELEMVENYIALSKIQLENRLTFTKEIDPEVSSLEIPPMLIQMLIENAVKHGISNLPNGGNVTLKVLKKDNTIGIEVLNTGKLVIDKNSTKVGLENIKKRLSLLYGEKATFLLTEKNNEVIASIKIPI